MNEEDEKNEPENFLDSEGNGLSGKISFSNDKNRSDSTFLAPDGQILLSGLHEEEKFSNGPKRDDDEIVTTKNYSDEEALCKNVDGLTLAVGTILCLDNFKINNDNITSNGEDNNSDSKEPKLKVTVEKLMTEKSSTLIPSTNFPIIMNLSDNSEDWNDDGNEPDSSLSNLFFRSVIDEQTLLSRLQNKEESSSDLKRGSDEIVTILNDGDKEISRETLIQNATIFPVDENFLNDDIPFQYVALQVD